MCIKKRIMKSRVSLDSTVSSSAAGGAQTGLEGPASFTSKDKPTRPGYPPGKRLVHCPGMRPGLSTPIPPGTPGLSGLDQKIAKEIQGDINRAKNEKDHPKKTTKKKKKTKSTFNGKGDPVNPQTYARSSACPIPIKAPADCRC